MADYTKTITIADGAIERMEDVTKRAQEMTSAVRALAIDAWHVARAFEHQLSPHIDEWDSTDAKRIREATGFDEMDLAMRTLALDLDTAVGGRPAGPPDWLEPSAPPQLGH